MGVMDQCIPTSVLPSKRNLPWLNSDIIRSIHDRNRAFKCAKKSGKLEHMKTIRGSETRSLTCSKVQNLMNLDPSNPKAFWKVTKLLTKQPTTIPILQDDGGNIIWDDAGKAKLLNIFLQNVSRELLSLKRSDYEEIDQTIIDECPTDLLCTVGRSGTIATLS